MVILGFSWSLIFSKVSFKSQLSPYILLNFKHLVEQVGHVPNGNRIYYTTRSQPPFFTQMVYDFYLSCKENPEAKGSKFEGHRRKIKNELLVFQPEVALRWDFSAILIPNPNPFFEFLPQKIPQEKSYVEKNWHPDICFDQNYGKFLCTVATSKLHRFTSPKSAQSGGTAQFGSGPAQFKIILKTVVYALDIVHDIMLVAQKSG